jgi:hypothetical protein
LYNLKESNPKTETDKVNMDKPNKNDNGEETPDETFFELLDTIDFTLNRTDEQNTSGAPLKVKERL